MIDTQSDGLGKVIKRQRKIKKLTLYQLGARADVSPSHLGRIERGERFPSARVLRRIAGPLDLKEIELFTLADFLPPPDDKKMCEEEQPACYMATM